MSSKIDADVLLERAKQPGFIVFKVPFDSVRKRQTTVVRFDDGTIRVYVKGAPDILITKCDRIYNSDGQVVPLDEGKKASLLGDDAVKPMARKCLRTIMIAYKDYTTSEWD